MIPITQKLSIEESELQFQFFTASGPGGQNVNKVATAVQLRFDVAHSPSLSEPARRRLAAIAGKRLSREGVLTIRAQRFRSQDRNREDAIERLQGLIRKAAEPSRPRRQTVPTVSSRERRLRAKHLRTDVKQLRREPDGQ